MIDWLIGCDRQTLLQIRTDNTKDRRHAVSEFTRFESLDGDFGRIVPQTFVHFTKLTMTDLTQEPQRALGYFPLVFCVVRQAKRLRFFQLKCHSLQYGKWVHKKTSNYCIFDTLIQKPQLEQFSPNLAMATRPRCVISYKIFVVNNHSFNYMTKRGEGGSTFGLSHHYHMHVKFWSPVCELSLVHDETPLPVVYYHVDKRK